MTDVAIRVEGLGKEYRLGAQQERYYTLGDQIRKWTSIRRLFSRAKRAESRPPFWALKDVSFEVKRGEVVGIIGRNGAGKSTLLKILSRITEPTEGGADIYGRVGSLLEVGTGFHPELTGRENIFLNGAILGMKRSEILRKFDEIVAFAEVDKFIDTPTKHYSSGMYMRLAFAVAAHMEPEILVVDEVLAVGDSRFQEKCLGKMGEVARGGRTVLFVSHSMPSVRQLCSRTILLAAGRNAADGPTSEIINRYLQKSRSSPGADLRDWSERDREASGEARIIRFEVNTPDGDDPGCVEMGMTVRMTMDVEFSEVVEEPTFGVLVYSIGGEPLLDLRSAHGGMRTGHTTGTVRVETCVSNLALYPGEYLLSPWVADHTMKRNIDWVKNVCVLLILPSRGSSTDLQSEGRWGKYWVSTEWNLQQL